jgi:2-polyprenyl-3-methyl-5-hydroxy-6-metoxy-1,4-benzoquinol methylase
MLNSISDLLIAPWTTCVVFTAIRLKIFTILSNEMMTVEELSSKCRAIPHLLKPVLDVFVSLGLMDLQNDKYMNSHFSRVYLVEGEPRYVGDFIKLLYDESKHWDKLYDIVVEGKTLCVEESTDKAKLRTFIKAMNNLGMLGEAEALRNSVDLSGCKQMVDAGGGSGLYSIFLCQKYPDLSSTILDRSQTLAKTEEMIASCEGRERIKLREADITKESLGENIDVVLLSDVIYDELEAVQILRNAWNCLCQNGILIIRGYYSDPDNSKSLFGALFVLNQLVFDPNRKIMTISSLQKNIRDIGFTITKILHLTERSFAVLAKK